MNFSKSGGIARKEPSMRVEPWPKAGLRLKKDLRFEEGSVTKVARRLVRDFF